MDGGEVDSCLSQIYWRDLTVGGTRLSDLKFLDVIHYTGHTSKITSSGIPKRSLVEVLTRHNIA